MALRGINLVNQHVGGAWVYQKVFTGLGLSREEIPFPAPTNGQVTGVFGGPRPQAFIESHRVLQQQIIAQLSLWGMAAVLPVWDGGVPSAWTEHYPAARVLVRSGKGNHITNELHPEDPMYLLRGMDVCNPNPSNSPWFWVY